MPLSYEEAAQHVGDEVSYTPRPGDAARPGVIEAVRQLAVVRFTDHDGGVLQVNPFCLELMTDQPTLFGNVHGG